MLEKPEVIASLTRHPAHEKKEKKKLLYLSAFNCLMTVFFYSATFLFQLNGMSGTTLCLASISTLCCISADRYFAVVRPMRYKHVLTPKRALCMLVLVWLGSLFFSCLPLIIDYEYHPGTNNCSPAWHRSCGLYAFMTILAFGVPLVTLLSTYGMIFSSIRRHTKKVSHWRISSSGPRGTQSSASGNEAAVTGRAYDPFLSNSNFDEAKQNCRRRQSRARIVSRQYPK